MPVPTPRPKEDRQTFISRCISRMHDLDPQRPRDQIIAMCFTSWRKAKGIPTPTETTQDTEPKWVAMARRLLKSKKANPRIKAYWQKRLAAWETRQKK